MNTRYYSKKQEKDVAKKLKGRVQSNSGATKFDKGDVRVNSVGMLIECKTKIEDSKSISIKKEWLEKNREEALAMRLSSHRATLAFNFGESQDNYYIISEKFMKEIITLLEKENENEL